MHDATAGQPIEQATESARLADHLRDLLAALQRLDGLLERAVIAAQATYGPGTAADGFRGLHISVDEAERLLARVPGMPLLWTEPNGLAAHESQRNATSRLAWLAEAFGLSAFDIDVVVIALAPEVDLRYERLYAFLQDDVCKRWPSVDLALNLLCPSVDDKFAQRRRFSPEAPLVRNGLLHLVADTSQPHPPLLAHHFRLDEQILRLLLGEPGIDARLQPFCELVRPAPSSRETFLPCDTISALRTLVVNARDHRQTLRLRFHGPRGAGKRRCADVLAAEANCYLLAADLGRAAAMGTDLHAVAALLFREAWFQDAILYLDGIDALHDESHATALTTLLEALAEDGGITILSGTAPWPGLHALDLQAITVDFDFPGFASRRNEWHASLSARGVCTSESTLDALADRFRITSPQIAAAVATAWGRAQLRAIFDPTALSGASRPSPVATHTAQRCAERSKAASFEDELFAAARSQCHGAIGALAHKIEPRHAWDDIVLPEDALAQLREICQRVSHRRRVLGDWGFDAKLSLGKGVNALFAGPSGTGKTMAAEIIASEQIHR
jgi:hypothetical protein